MQVVARVGNPFKLRHPYATLLRRAGADIADIQELLGHKSPKTTQRYAMVVPEKLVAATQRAEEQWTQSRTKGGNSVGAKFAPCGHSEDVKIRVSGCHGGLRP